MPKLLIVLFIDGSITNEPDIYDKLKKLISKNFIIVEYTCCKFTKTGTNKHIELFGSMIRFLPIFNFPGNNTNKVFILDADSGSYELIKNLKDYKIFEKTNVDYFYVPNIFYSLFVPWTLKDDHTILAGKHMCKIKFPISLLTQFFECTMLKTCADIDIMKNKLNYDKYKTFPYGIDEYFLNYLLLPYIKQHNIVYGTVENYTITAAMFYIKDNPKCDIGCKNSMTQFLSKILNEPNNDNLEKLYTKFDSILYNAKDKYATDKQKKIATNYYNELKILREKKDYSVFPKDILDIISTYEKDNTITKTYVNIFKGYKKIKKYVLHDY